MRLTPALVRFFLLIRMIISSNMNERSPKLKYRRDSFVNFLARPSDSSIWRNPMAVIVFLMMLFFQE